MASSQSTPTRYDNINLFKQENLQLVAQQMAMKQGNVDQTRAMLEELEVQIGMNLDLANPNDKKYLADRLAQAKGLVYNAMNSGADISDPLVSKKLFSQMKETVNDPNILNAVTSTQKGRQLMATMEHYRLNDPEKYNDRNAQVAMEGWVNYVNADGIGNVYSGGEYTPYVDLDKRFTDKDINKLLTDMNINAEYVQVEGGNGYFKQKNTYEGTVDPERLQQAIRVIAGEDGLKQWQIDSKYYFGDGSNPQKVELIKSQYDALYNQELSTYKQEYEATKLKYDATKNSTERQKLSSKLEQLQNKIDSLGDQDFNSLVTGQDGFLDSRKFQSIANELYIKREQNRYFSLLFQDPLLKDSEVDDFSYKAAQFQQDLNEHEWTKTKDRHKMAMSEANYELNLMKAVNSGEVRTDDQGNPILDPRKGGHNTSLDFTNQDLTADKTKLDTMVLKEFGDAVEGVKDLFTNGGYNYGTTTALGAALSADPNWRDKKSITVNGQTIDLTDESNRAKLQRFQDAYNGQGGFMNDAKDKTMNYFNSGVNAVIDAFQKGGDARQSVYDFARNTTNGYFKQVGDKNFVWEEGVIPANKTGMSNISYLLHKKENKTLTPSEEATLKMLLMPSIAKNDTKMTSEEKRIMMRAFQDEVYQNLGTRAVNTMPKFSTIMVGSVSESDVKVNTNTGTDVDVTDGVIMVRDATTYRGLNKHRGDISTISGYNSITRDAYNGMKATLDNARGELGNIREREIILHSNSTDAGVLKSRIPSIGNEYKQDLILTPIAGDPDNVLVKKAVKVKFKNDAGLAQEKIEWQPVTNNDGTVMKVPKSTFINLNFESTQRTPYDSSLSNPAEIDLGWSVAPSDQLGGSKVTENFKVRANSLRNQLDGEALQSFNQWISDFENSRIGFKWTTRDSEGKHVKDAPYQLKISVPSRGIVNMPITNIEKTRLHYETDIAPLTANTTQSKEADFLEALRREFGLN